MQYIKEIGVDTSTYCIYVNYRQHLEDYMTYQIRKNVEYAVTEKMKAAVEFDKSSSVEAFLRERRAAIELGNVVKIANRHGICVKDLLEPSKPTPRKGLYSV